MARGTPAPADRGVGRDKVGTDGALDDAGCLYPGDLLKRQCGPDAENPIVLGALHQTLDVLLEWLPSHRGAPRLGHDHVGVGGEGAADTGEVQVFGPRRPVPVDPRRRETDASGVTCPLALPVETEGLAHIHWGAGIPQYKEPHSRGDDGDEHGEANPQSPESVLVAPRQRWHATLVTSSAVRI